MRRATRTQKMDTNHDGRITFDEFILASLDDDTLIEALSLFDT